MTVSRSCASYCPQRRPFQRNERKLGNPSERGKPGCSKSGELARRNKVGDGPPSTISAFNKIEAESMPRWHADCSTVRFVEDSASCFAGWKFGEHALY